MRREDTNKIFQSVHRKYFYPIQTQASAKCLHSNIAFSKNFLDIIDVKSDNNFLGLPPNNMYKHRGEDEQFAVKRVERMLVMFAKNHAQNLQRASGLNFIIQQESYDRASSRWCLYSDPF